MIYRKPFKYPAAKFKPGQHVRFEEQIYRVIASTHTHTQLEGVGSAIANWRLVKVNRE